MITASTLTAEYKKVRLDYFIKFELWVEAIKLIEEQIKQIKLNKGYKKLNTLYFNSIDQNERNNLIEENFFYKNVANSLFYNLSNQFFYFDYMFPKHAYGLRYYKFFSYPLRCVYFSICLYLQKISQEFVDDYNNNLKEVKSYYGGNLRFNNEKLALSYDHLNHKPHYIKFLNQLDPTTFSDKFKEQGVIIHLDIQNYFEKINIEILLKQIGNKIKPSIIKKHKFDEFTQKQILFFFDYLFPDKSGIPQSDNDICSGFIGHLYLIFADIFISDYLKGYQNLIEKYKIVRFVDDYYLLIQFKEIDKKEKIGFIPRFLEDISDNFFKILKLRLNAKTDTFWFDNDKEIKRFKEKLKKVSSEDYCIVNNDPVEETKKKCKDPQSIILEIFKLLKKLKREFKGFDISLDRKQENYFKEIYNEKIYSLLKKEENKKKLRKIFDKNFNFDVVKLCPLPLLIIITSDKKIESKFKNFIEQKKNISYRDADILIKYLCQKEELLKNDYGWNKLHDSELFNNICKIIKAKTINNHLSTYFNLGIEHIYRMTKEQSIIEQAKARLINELKNNYNIALQHLYNEFQHFCYYNSDFNKEIKNFDIKEIEKFLRNKNVKEEYINQIKILSDYRNNNQAAHASCDTDFCIISEEIYKKYKKSVEKTLKNLLEFL